MEPFLYWLLRATLLSALFYGFYRLFPAKTALYAVNRCSLILIALTVSVLPLFRFSLIPEKEPKPVTATFPTDFLSLPVTEYVETQPQTEIPWMQILMTLFASGFLFTAIRYLTGLCQMGVIIRKSEKQPLEDHAVLCITDRNVSPFSWMKYIVLARRELPADSRTVIRHEMAHIRLRHSFDMIFFDIFTCLFWFNPFAWLLRREIRSVHEYQADRQVLDYGIDSKQYQLLLIRRSVGEHKFAMANNFRQRDLHKRITMMKKNKTNRLMKWNYAMALPSLFLAMIALSVPKLNAKAVEKKNEKVTVSGVVRGYADPTDEVVVIGYRTQKRNNVRYSVSIGREGIIKGASVPAEGIADETITDTDGMTVLKTEATKDGGERKLFYRFIDGKRPLCIIDGAPVSEAEFQKLKPEDVKSFSVLKDKSAIESYGEAGKNGVILVETKKHGEITFADPALTDSLRGEVKSLIRVTTSGVPQDPDSVLTIVDGEKKSPLIIADGEPVSEAEFQKLNPEEIKSVSVLKDEYSIASYGEAGKNGVILIKTKKHDGITSTDLVLMDSLRGDIKTLIKATKSGISPDLRSALIIVDGEKMPKGFPLSSISPHDIESISILKDKSAADIYGEEGKNGVVIITKKTPKQNP
ncbi:MAG: TonB-dependent receptor plug domain-containing protein [Proteiniphilum sp.]|jgi:TonB-dependent SusC/RagA subfamily outer membrane receptor|nr:TonB-dependent receptor plug domain-containing protein [Proteiniphilum sp.]